MLDGVLDVVLRLVTAAVIAALAIPVLVLGIELFYAVPFFVFVPLMIVVIAVAVWACRAGAAWWRVHGGGL